MSSNDEITRLRAENERLREWNREIALNAREFVAENERLREELDTWKSVFPDIAPQNVMPDRSLVEQENERLRAALESVDTWLDRWAVHVGRCEGGHRCTCGLTAIRYEVSAALAAQPAPGKEEA